MNQFLIKKLSFGPIYPGGDVDFPVCAEREQRIDHNRDVPKLCEAAGVKHGDIVIDVGGFIGDTAYAFEKAGARVYMFEPFLDSFVCALYNTRRMRVECFNRAVGNGETVKFIYECPGPNFGMRRVQVVEQGAPDSTIALKLDDFDAQTGLPLGKVRLLKIDCEGFEIPTLLGARKLIEKHRPILYVEHYVDGQKNCGFTPQQLVETIHSLGYTTEMWGEPPRWDWFCRPIEPAK